MASRGELMGVHELLTLHLECTYGTNYVEALESGKIMFRFPTTHHGSNELIVGSWKVVAKTKVVSYLILLSYNEAYEYLKAGTKPEKEKVIALDRMQKTKV